MKTGKDLFDKVSFKASKTTTLSYSTSFSLGIRFLDQKFHEPIYAIYGFVRFADEIVDTFHEYDKKALLQRYREDTGKALEEGISLNPILNSFQQTVTLYKIDHSLIDTFLNSMEMDLYRQEYNRASFEKYILGSAEVVGLMCLKVFCEGNRDLYEQLKSYAMRLGAAFQKVNFLRDLKTDYQELGRSYFPGMTMENPDKSIKILIENEIDGDFAEAYKGILMLPKNSRFGVYLAYIYYMQLFTKIKAASAEALPGKRIRIPNTGKVSILLNSYLKYNLNII